VLSVAAISCAKTKPVAASAQPTASAQPAQPVASPAQSTATPATSSTKPATPAKHTSSATKTAAKPAQPLGAPVKSYGSPNAPIMMEVFTDYECPSCRNLYDNTLKDMINDYVAAGKVYLVHHDFPLPMHKYGYEAARWLNASARIGKFASVEEALYDHQNDWAADGNIAKYVSAAMSPADFKRVETIMSGCGFDAPPGLKSVSFSAAHPVGDACSVDSYIEADRALGNAIPVQSTPTYVITYKGKRLPVGAGAVSWPILKQFFDSLLSQ
jgi:protein-disulfide isomerase